jgi:hypothetical protein
MASYGLRSTLPYNPRQYAQRNDPFELHLERLAPLVGAAEPYALTPLGERVRAGEADFVRDHGVDRWLGGLHLRGTGPVWRWNGTHSVRA